MRTAEAIRSALFLSVLVLLAAICGCGGGEQSNPPLLPPAPSTGQIFVANGLHSTIYRFGMGDNGDVTAKAKITSTSLHAPIALLDDTVNDRLYTFSLADADIVIFNNASTRNGNIAPDRVVVGPATSLPLLSGFISAALDNPRDLLYVTTISTILVFASASSINGNVPPSHVINTGFKPTGLFLDPVNDRLFVSDAGTHAVDIFDHASTLNGAVVPDRTISGDPTQFVSPGPLALDSSGRLIVCSAPGQQNFFVFANAATANGNVAPSASGVIPGTIGQASVSPAGELYVTDGGVEVFSNIATATGMLSPRRTIAGPHTGLDIDIPGAPPLVIGLAIDPTR